MNTPSDPSLRALQEKVDQWIHEIGVRYFSPLTNLAQLMEEVGELARQLSRQHGDQSYKNREQVSNLEDELADILFVIICLANQNGIDLQLAFEKNLDKKCNRDLHRHKNNPKLRS